MIFTKGPVVVAKDFYDKPQGLIRIGHQVYFLKRGIRDNLESEAKGLEALICANHSLVIPHPILIDHDHKGYFLISESLDLRHPPNWYSAARGISDLHLNTSTNYGWACNNWIGLDEQINTWSENWSCFFINWRIKPKLEKLKRLGFHLNKEKNLLSAIDFHLSTHNPEPALLHGDLWRGNIGFTEHGPAVFDPSCYYGDREVDIAMTKLFGSFPPQFYQTYCSFTPLYSLSSTRHTIYNFYHILNHAIIFGGNYFAECKKYAISLLD